jgi:predicted DNA-binding protein
MKMQTKKEYTNDPKWLPKEARMSVRLTTEQYSKVWMIAKGKGKVMSDIIREMIDNA